MSFAKQFISALVAEDATELLYKHGNIEHLFKSHEVTLYSFVTQFAKQYGEFPTEETIFNHTQIELTKASQTAEYYLDLLKVRHVEHELKSAMQSASGKLSVEDKDPEAALEILASSVMQLIAQKHNTMITDFRHAYDMIVPDYIKKFTHDQGLGVKLGWPSVDERLGGAYRGDFISLIGRPGQGKTWLALFSAFDAWAVQSLSVMFVSMEMKPLSVEQRLTSMLTKIPAGKLKKGMLTTPQLKTLKEQLTEIQFAKTPLWVVDGNLTSTVEDIWAMARQLKPDIIYIDGGYLVKHPTERDRFKRVAENSNLMKLELTDIAPLFVSWQFAKSAAKKMKKTKSEDQPDLEDIGYSDAIAQDSSVVMALLAAETVETIIKKKITLPKVRDDIGGSFEVRWDFDKMDFSEIVPKDPEELQFM